ATARTAADTGAAVWTTLAPAVSADAFVYFIYEESGDALVPAFRGGAPAVGPRTRIRPGDRLSGWVAAAQQSIVNSDARLDLDADVRDDTLLRSALAVPVCRDDQTLGVLAFYAEQPLAFGDDQQRLATAAASAIAARVMPAPAAALVRS